MSKPEAQSLLDHSTSYYRDVAPMSHAMKAFTELTYQPGYTETDAKKIRNEAMLFSRDCQRKELSPHQIDHAVEEWRCRDTAFMPSFGQFYALALQADSYRYFAPYEATCLAIVAPRFGGAS